MTADALIRVSGLGKVFGRTLVLDRVTFEVRAGQTMALLGPNGAGKTTLLKIIATLVRPTRGAVTIAGCDTVKNAEAVRSLIGLVAHGAYVYEDLTALENLTFWTTFAGRRVADKELRSALADIELEHAAEERVRTFSHGMKRRLGLARLALTEPRVLLLDEPFAGLDQRARKWLEEYLRTVKARGGAALMVTHGFGADLEVADRIGVLAGGRIVLDRPRGGLALEELGRLYALATEETL